MKAVGVPHDINGNMRKPQENVKSQTLLCVLHLSGEHCEKRGRRYGTSKRRWASGQSSAYKAGTGLPPVQCCCQEELAHWQARKGCLAGYVAVNWLLQDQRPCTLSLPHHLYSGWVFADNRQNPATHKAPWNRLFGNSHLLSLETTWLGYWKGMGRHFQNCASCDALCNR